MPTETRTIRQKIFLKAPPNEIFDALIDPEKQSEFTGSVATGLGAVGSEFSAWDGYIKGRHLVLERGKKIVQEWYTAEWPPGLPPSRLEIILEAKEGGTELLLEQRGVPSDQAALYEKGWVDFYWSPLEDYLMRGQRSRG